MVRGKRVYKSILSHFFEREYVTDKYSKYVIAFLFLLSLIVLGDWYTGIRMYLLLPGAQGFYYLGLSIVTTVMILLSLAVAYLLPHFEPTLRPTGFRRSREERNLMIMLVVIITILFLITTSLFIMSLTGAHGQQI